MVRAGGKMGVAIVVVASGVAATLTGAEPTGHDVVDRVLSFSFAAGATAAGASAGFGVLALAAALALAGFASLDGLGAAAALSAVAAVAVVGMRPRAHRAWSALAAALAVQSLARNPTLTPFGLSAAAGALAFTALVTSAYLAASPAGRRRMRRIGFSVFLYLLAAVAGVIASIARSRDDATTAVDLARAALTSARNGSVQTAADQSRAAAAALDRLEARIDGWWTWPGRTVPVLAQHLSSARALVDGAAETVATTSAVLSSTNLDVLVPQSGRIDPARVSELAAPTERVADALDAARREIDASRSRWHVAPFARALETVERRLTTASADAHTAADAARVLPAMLGRERPRVYFVAFTTPAEARGLGGFMGNFAELTIDDGRMALTRFGRTAELLAGGDPPRRTISGPPDYVARYGRFDPARRWQNVTMSPDFPSVAAVMAELYPQSGGRPVDGVIVVDPTALSALLKLTGPVTVAGLAEPLTADNAKRYLLVDQYARDNSERIDALGQVAFSVFSKLVDSDFPPGATIAEIFGPLIRANRLMVWSAAAAEEAVIDRIGAAGSFVAPVDDGLAVTNHNGNPSKIDAFLRRSVSYRATIDAATGRVRSTATIALTNTAPAGGLEPIVIGNDQGLAIGTNRTYISVYTPLGLKALTVGGAARAVTSERELGQNVYSTTVDIAPGATVTVQLELEGVVTLGDGDYRFTYRPQPLAAADTWEASFSLVGAKWLNSSSIGHGGSIVADEKRDIESPLAHVLVLPA